MRNKKFSLIAFALIISMIIPMMTPLTFADAPKYEKVLKIVSGSQSNLGTFTYNGHDVSKGFAVAISMMAAVEPNEWSFSKAGFAVSLASGWSETPYPYLVSYSYEPRVSDMWVKVQGNSNFRIDTGGIADNTGTGGSCTESWEVVLSVLEEILLYVLEHLAQQPPLTEWQSDLHWAKAITRSKEPYEGGHLNPTYNPGVETAGCDFNSLFLQNGYQYLTITAGADICLVRGYWARGDYWYWESIPIGTYSVTFQVEVPVTNEPETPSTPSGQNSGYKGISYSYSTSTIDPDGDDVRYQFDWGDGSTTTTGWYASGFTASASHTWGSSGTYYVKVRAQDVYEEWSNWSPYLTVTISGGGGGGGCPYVYTWDGQQYVMDNNLLPASEMSNGADVEDRYMLGQPLVPSHQGAAFSLYSLQIREFEHEHDFIDQVKLAALDHASDVKIAVTPKGEILTYRQPLAPLSCIDNNGTNRLNEVASMDGNVSDTTTYFEGYPSDCLILNFGKVDAENAKLILRDDMKCMDVCIEVQVPSQTGDWQTVEVLNPRNYWAIEAVDLSEYVVENEDLLVRLYWTSPHRLDYVGLDTTPQASIEVHQAFLLSAFHSTQGNVKPLLMKNDQTYAELTPRQQIQLTFQLPNNQNQKRTFILYTEGHYTRIET